MGGAEGDDQREVREMLDANLEKIHHRGILLE